MTLDKSQAMHMLRTMILIREFDELAIELRDGRQDLRRRASLRRPGGRRRRRLREPDDATDRVTSTHRGPRALHRQGRRHQAHDGRAVRPRRRLLQGQGRLDAHRRLRRRHARAPTASSGGGLPIASGAALAAQLDGKGDVDGLLLRRRRGGGGRVPRGAQHRVGVEAADRLRLREQPVRARTTRSAVQHPVADVAAHARRATACPASSSTATTCWRSARRPREAVERARGAARGRRSLECKTYRWHFHAMRDAPPPETPPGRRDRAVEGARPDRALRGAR